MKRLPRHSRGLFRQIARRCTLRRAKAFYRSLQKDANWRSTKPKAVKGAVGGIIADVFSPWLNIIGWAFPVSILVALGGSAAWHYCKRRSATSAACSRRGASSALYGLIGCSVLGPIFFAHAFVSEDDKGVVASLIPAVASLQATIDKRMVAVESKLDRQVAASESMRNSMDQSTALLVLDRATQARDGSSQGQSAALESLASIGHRYTGTDFSGVSFELAHLPGIDLSEAVLHFTSFSGGDLSKSNLSGSGLRFAILDRANLAQADVSGTFAPFLSAQGTNFRDATLARSNLFGSDLRNADLRGADLTSTNLRFADLRGADLRGAKLQSAYLAGANLTGANLLGATLENTEMLAVRLIDGKLAEQQRQGMCRRQPDRDGRVRVELVESWASARFASGMEFEPINAFTSLFYSKYLLDNDLPLCSNATEAHSSGLYLDSWELYIDLDRKYLGKAGRRKTAREVFARMLARATAQEP